MELNSAPMLCIHDVIRMQARRIPDAVAITAPGRRPLTYRRLHSHVEEVVAALHAMGVGRSGRVALVLPNGPEMAVAFLAVAAGATCVPLNPAYRAAEFKGCLSDLDVRTLIVQSGIDSPAREVAWKRGIPIIELLPAGDAAAGLFTLAGPNDSPAAHARFAPPDDVAVLLQTSGTTSRPKIVPLTQRNVCTFAHETMKALALTERDRCLNVMPLFHLHGLIRALLSSVVAGASVICAPGLYPSEFFHWLENFGATWYTAVPTMHQAILARAAQNREFAARCPLRLIGSSSSALPPQVMRDLEALFQAPVIEYYGLSETGLIACNPLPPGERRIGSVGRVAGREMVLMSEGSRVLPTGQVGEIVIRAVDMMRSYENDPEANERAFVNGWFHTGDAGYLDDDGYLFITGRLKEIINRGGEKIAPREVEEVLLDHPAVAQAVAFAVPDPRLGEEVAAAVVLRENASATERELRAYAAGRLVEFKVPRRVLFLEDLPKLPTGKGVRIGLAKRLGLRSVAELSEDRAPFRAPESPVEAALAGIWAEVLGLERVGIDSTFFELGGDSMLATQVASRVRDTFRVELPLRSLFDRPTVADLAAAITQSLVEQKEMASLLTQLERSPEENIDDASSSAGDSSLGHTARPNVR